MLTNFSLGKVAAPTPGTPVQLSAPASLPAVRSLTFSVIAGGSGKVYLGVAGMNKSTMAGVLKEFWPNTGTGPDDTYVLQLHPREAYNVTDFYVDANNANEGLIVSGTAAPF